MSSAPAAAPRPAAQAILCPFTIVVDSREQKPYAFASIRADARQQNRPVQVPIHGAALPQGDYSIQGWEDRVAIERKSLADLYSTLGHGRERFGRELARLNDLWFACVVVEAEWGTVMRHPPFRSELLPKTVYRSILAWMVRYPSVHWCLVPGREFAEVTTFRLLERFWKEWEREQRSL